MEHQKSINWQEYFPTLSEIWMCVMTRQSVSDLSSPLFQVSNALRLIAALTQEMERCVGESKGNAWPGDWQRGQKLYNNNYCRLYTTRRYEKRQRVLCLYVAGRDINMWKYFIFMGVSHSIPSIRNEDTFNMNLGTSKESKDCHTSSCIFVIAVKHYRAFVKYVLLLIFFLLSKRCNIQYIGLYNGI